MQSSGNLASQQFLLAQQISLAPVVCRFRTESDEVFAIVPVTIAHAAALPAFGHAEPGWHASAPIKSNNLRAVQVGMVAALLTAGNAK